MWNDKKDILRPPEDPLMKQMARKLLQPSAHAEQEHIRRSALEQRFGVASPESSPAEAPSLPLTNNAHTLPTEQQTTVRQLRLKSDAFDRPTQNTTSSATQAAEKTSETSLDPEQETPAQPANSLDKLTVSPLYKNQARPDRTEETCTGMPNAETAPALKRRTIQETRKFLRSPKISKHLAATRTPRRFRSFREVLEFSQTQFPLPHEMQLSQKPEYQTWLRARLANCNSRKDLSYFAFSLNYKDLAILFPTLATLNTGEEIDKLLSIILMRASKYLYIQGWLTLQYAYPRSTVQKGLALLCEVLEEQQTAEHQFSKNTIPLQATGLHLGTGRFDWQSVHLISEISLPNTRHFLATIIKFIRDSEVSGEDFFKRYGIYRELSLGEAIISQWEMAMFESNLHQTHPLRNLFKDKD